MILMLILTKFDVKNLGRVFWSYVYRGFSAKSFSLLAFWGCTFACWGSVLWVISGALFRSHFRSLRVVLI